MQSIKEHNLKANHNAWLPFIPASASVCNLSKNTIWKQITTHLRFRFRFLNLYAIYQRTQSESKSQPINFHPNGVGICMQSIKEHNLKANHNPSLISFFQIASVCNLSKNTIWKQITTISSGLQIALDLYAIYQRTQSESKSQLTKIFSLNCHICMQSIKEHNLKANHNFIHNNPKHTLSVCNLSKNTIWKQITTTPLQLCNQKCLYAIYQRTQSESKSQLPGGNT